MNPTLLVLVQLLVILLLARLCGLLLRRAGQPPVIGEMAAGLLLGPIVFGTWLPELHGALFAEASLPALSSLATLGVTLFMFVVGLELRRPEGNRSQVRSALLIGLFGIALPMTLGLLISPRLHASFAPPGVDFWPFALFMATALSVTAFPVLARILRDRGLSRSTPGRLALGAALIDDGCVWIFLAIVLAVTGAGTASGLLRAVLGAAVLAAATMLVLSPLYACLLRSRDDDGEPPSHLFAWVLIGLLACSAFAEWIGLHPVFGAFLFGICLPRDDRLPGFLTRRIEPLAVLLLMPVLFAVVGQGTSPEVFTGAGPAAFALILSVAIVGKVVGCAVGARLSGHGWRDSLAVGSLMNARGLMELVVIKIGFDAGLIGPELFTLLFGMTLVTTVMASPMLRMFHGRRAETHDASAAQAARG